MLSTRRAVGAWPPAVSNQPISITFQLDALRAESCCVSNCATCRITGWRKRSSDRIKYEEFLHLLGVLRSNQTIIMQSKQLVMLDQPLSVVHTREGLRKLPELTAVLRLEGGTSLRHQAPDQNNMKCNKCNNQNLNGFWSSHPAHRCRPPVDTIFPPDGK